MKKTFLFFGAICFSFAVIQAQSKAELEMAMQMAKQAGYSDSQINATLSQMQGNGTGVQQTSQQPALEINRIPDEATQQVATPETYPSVMQYVVEEPAPQIYGHSIFSTPNQNFVPSYNIPTPVSYQLAAGDQIVIDLWGGTSASFAYTISPEGSVTIPNVGPVYLNGQTIESAGNILKQRMSQIYSGLVGDNPNTFMRVTLGQLRSLTVNVVGDAVRPGAYTLPSLSTVLSALYMAGGPSDLGTIRQVKVFRAGKLYKSIDVYRYLAGGDMTENIRLEDNDVIRIDAYQSLVKVSGQIKRPMIYELTHDETVQNLIDYAGGFASKAKTDNVHITRQKGERLETFDVAQAQFNSFLLQDGDSVSITQNIDFDRNQLNIQGAVWFPGDYAIQDGTTKLSQLIEKAGGVRQEAYLGQGYISRYDSVRNKIALNFELQDILHGFSDIELQNFDTVYIFSLDDMRTDYYVRTIGAVNAPKDIPYRKGMTLTDAILFSNNFKMGANLTHIEIARRIIDGSESSTNSDTVAHIIHVNWMDQPELHNLELSPYDIILVRTSPSFHEQKIVTVEGEVTFAGSYVIESNIVHLSEILDRAGGFTRDAYVEGAYIERVLNEDERKKLQDAIEQGTAVETDTTLVNKLSSVTSYRIGIDIRKAISNPGSVNDMILRDGDIIHIPLMNSVVTIRGNGVISENSVVYRSDYKWRDYVREAGGFNVRAAKKMVYVANPNGTMSTKHSKGGLKILPGSEIIVPQKESRERRPLTPGEVVSLGTSAVSLATLVMTMIK
ncbi:MAG: SLBB domain-containing protein [Bacteroidaceae bacterium]|nr:SLBB domain-containing protein [Bacteroidaceae bacterium]